MTAGVGAGPGAGGSKVGAGAKQPAEAVQAADRAQAQQLDDAAGEDFNALEMEECKNFFEKIEKLGEDEAAGALVATPHLTNY